MSTPVSPSALVVQRRLKGDVGLLADVVVKLAEQVDQLVAERDEGVRLSLEAVKREMGL